MKKTLPFSLLILAFLMSCESEPSTVNMLTNHGLNKRAWLHVNEDNYTTVLEASMMWDAHLDGNTPNSNMSGWPTWGGEAPVSSPDKSNPSVLLMSRGYDNSMWNRYPGFCLWQFDPEVKGDPIRFVLVNNAVPLADANSLHKVGFMFEHASPTESGGRWSFKKAYKLGDFKEVKPKFDAALEKCAHALPIRNTGVYLAASLKVAYVDDEAKIVRKDVLAVIFSRLDKSDFNKKPNDEIYYQGIEKINGETINKKFLLADKLKLPYIQDGNYSLSSDGADGVKWTSITFDFRKLMEDHMSPPKGYSIEDAVIIGFEVYSVSGSADLNFWLKDVQLNGVN